MSRPSKCRLVANLPGVTYFKPEGVPLKCLEEAHISVEEIEALRLKDVEGYEQEAGAAMMHVSRPTFQRILASARRTIADALLSGKAIRIEGGNYELSHNNDNLPQSTNGCPDYGRRLCCKHCPKMPATTDVSLKTHSEPAATLSISSQVFGDEESHQQAGRV